MNQQLHRLFALFNAVYRSMGYAINGIVQTWHHERNFCIEVVIGVVALGLAWWLNTGRVVVAVLCGLVWALELVNTAIEAVVDLAMPHTHPLAKRAKDAAAGAVLVVALVALCLGVGLFAPPLWAMLWNGWTVEY